VNNGVAPPDHVSALARAGNPEIEPNELLEGHGERMHSGAAGESGAGAHSGALGEVQLVLDDLP
jgi:hypothetical protein